jgi:hypothetical protein
LAAINEFTAKIGVAGIAVCSRSEEYRTLAAQAKLRVSAAVRLHPLTEARVDQYLEAAGDVGLSGLRGLVKEDPVLRELSQNPLMLAVMTRAYERLPAQVFNRGDLDTPDKRRDHIFGTYVERLMHHAIAPPRPYSEGFTRTFLSWLAGRLNEHSVSVFFIEQLQPTWLDGWASRWSYFILSRMLGSALISVPLTMFLVVTDDTKDLLEVRKWLGAAIGAALALGFGVALVDAMMATIRRTSNGDGRLMWLAWVSARLASYGIVSSLLMIAGYSALNAMRREANRGDVMFFAVFATVIIGALLWTMRNIDRTPSSDVRTLEAVTLSLRGALGGSLKGALYGIALVMTPVVVLILIVLILALLEWNFTGGVDIILVLLSLGLFLAVFFGLLGMCLGAALGAFETGIRKTKNRPNEGIWLSAKNAMFVALVVGGAVIAIGSSWNLGSLLNNDFSTEFYIVIEGLLGGAIVGFYYAGLDIAEHYVLRLILLIRRETPLRYVNFLDYVARLTFLRKVGGGYIFLHPLMVDYFATHPRPEPSRVFANTAEASATADNRAVSITS